MDVLVTKKTYEWEEETDIPGCVVRRCGVASARVPPSDLNLICDDCRSKENVVTVDRDRFALIATAFGAIVRSTQTGVIRHSAF